jgi:hypothetical protein
MITAEQANKITCRRALPVDCVKVIYEAEDYLDNYSSQDHGVSAIIIRGIPEKYQKPVCNFFEAWGYQVKAYPNHVNVVWGSDTRYKIINF